MQSILGNYSTCSLSALSILMYTLMFTVSPETGVLDKPYSAKPAQWSSHTGPPVNIGWTRFQPM